MMKTVNVHEAKTHLSKLLTRVNNENEEIIIAKAGKPYAKLVPLPQTSKRQPGIELGSVTAAFFEPLPEEELLGWEK
ncbi:MAG: type II toxin-antitoxin system Phd/YefM family antitoxin [Candidatus Electrothrix sp. AR3]|nr:type II toxin-antitoxin system Phd/YefM family antitoxin [Candidatus Electrothrix sp. AR3]